MDRKDRKVPKALLKIHQDESFCSLCIFISIPCAIAELSIEAGGEVVCC